MKFNKYLLSLAFGGLALMSMVSCKEDDLGPTIFPDTSEELDNTSYTYKFDRWLQENFLKQYNLTFLYKMEDVATDMNYNLVPAEFQKSQDLAVLTKYLWFDAYKKVAGEDFLKAYGPRIIHLIGSAAINPTSGTEILGLAEGGIKVSLFKVNDMNLNSAEMLNEYYFKTMHHEFAHILHQTKSIPTEFGLLSNGRYDSSNWQDRNLGVVNSLGFVTTYGSSELREDYAEIIANYIVKTDAQWAAFKKNAARGWAKPKDAPEESNIYYCYFYYKDNEVSEDNKTYVAEGDVKVETDEDGNESYTLRDKKDDKGEAIVVYPVPDEDNVDGLAVLERKIEIARTWFREQWNIDLDALRNEVQTRQSNFNISELRKDIENMQ